MYFLDITIEDYTAAATLIAALFAAITSLIVAYFSRKSQDKIEKQRHLIQENIELLKNQLDRNKDFSAFQREKIFRHLEEVFNSFSQIHSIVNTVQLRLWMTSNSDLETEMKFRQAHSRLKIHFYSLYGFRVITEKNVNDFDSLDKKLIMEWDMTMGQAAYRTEEFIRDFPDADKNFDRNKYHDAWLNLLKALERMENFIFSLNSVVKVPN